MPKSRYAEKRDENEPQIIAAFVAAGWLVKKHGLGYGADFTAYGINRSEVCEVKRAGRYTLTESETKLRYELTRRGIPYRIIQDVESAMEIINGF